MTDRNTKIRGGQFRDDDLKPADLKSTNSPSDEQVPSYDVATQNFTWVDKSNCVRGTFDNGDLSSGVLTITHNLGLSAPYTILIMIYDNNFNLVWADEVTGSANSHDIDLSSFGTITGTWGYIYIG